MFELDGKRVEALARRDDLAGRASGSAPTSPISATRREPGYRPDGNCRACMVEIEGERVLAASCIRKPAAGMQVTDRDRARREGAQDGDGAAGRRPAGARDVP